MPGFRPGKVPANLVKKMHGCLAASGSAQHSIQEGVHKTIADNKLRPAMQPQCIWMKAMKPGKDAVVTVSFEVLPAIAAVSTRRLKLEKLTVPKPKAPKSMQRSKLASGSTRALKPLPKGQQGRTGDRCHRFRRQG
jgi:trigger factor